MREFKDTSNDRWQIDLHIGAVARVRSATEGRFNLWEPESTVDGVKLLAIATEDAHLATFWELLEALCRPQAESRGLTSDQFGQRLAADSLFDARAAFLAEWQDFFQKLQRHELALTLEKTVKYQRRAKELLETRLRSPMMATVDETVEQKMQSILNASFSSLPALLESIPDGTPAAKSS